jgi:hypothetical protein
MLILFTNKLFCKKNLKEIEKSDTMTRVGRDILTHRFDCKISGGKFWNLIHERTYGRHHKNPWVT